MNEMLANRQSLIFYFLLHNYLSEKAATSPISIFDSNSKYGVDHLFQMLNSLIKTFLGLSVLIKALTSEQSFGHGFFRE